MNKFCEENEISSFTALEIQKGTIGIDFYRKKITKRHLGKIVDVKNIDKDFFEKHKNEILYSLTYSQ